MSTAQPSDQPRERVKHHAAIHLSLVGRVLSDVGEPRLVGVASEPPPDQVKRGDLRQPGAFRQAAIRKARIPSSRMIDSTVLWLTTTSRPNMSSAVTRLDPIGPARGLVHVNDLAGQPDPAKPARRIGPVLPRVIARHRHLERPTSVLDVDPLPGQRADHREEPFGLIPSFRNSSLMFLETASSVSNCSIPVSARRPARAPARSSCRLLATIDAVLLEPAIDRPPATPNVTASCFTFRSRPRQFTYLTAADTHHDLVLPDVTKMLSGSWFGPAIAGTRSVPLDLKQLAILEARSSGSVHALRGSRKHLRIPDGVRLSDQDTSDGVNISVADVTPVIVGVDRAQIGLSVTSRIARITFSPPIDGVGADRE